MHIDGDEVAFFDVNDDDCLRARLTKAEVLGLGFMFGEDLNDSSTSVTWQSITYTGKPSVLVQDWRRGRLEPTLNMTL